MELVPAALVGEHIRAGIDEANLARELPAMADQAAVQLQQGIPVAALGFDAAQLGVDER